ncbi:hypothetical protein B0A48_03546 [Cryoendolithus antarcticus]|uniref:Heterokaryon incompatibility domain-containing protein n=1 Tax=Cryoendolithus antarcticus TaxID=1507870 RepID=A0A1V8TKC3_9PEZI|nr:hypothetical protein B0A48_03546 [Cryoendolithus antarcticus]
MPSTAGDVTYFQSNFRRTFKGWWQRTPTGPYDFLNHSREEIRLLCILPASKGVPEEALFARTRIVSLLDKPQYECISYCWGDPEKTEMVIFQGQPVKVTSNLASALRCFRAEADEEVWLWADALCINQNNITERNQQVQLMARIYSDASNVRAWIEWPGWEETTMGLLSPREMRLGAAWLLEATLDFFISGRAILPTLNGAQLPMLAGMRELFLNPFWQRIWITQELVLASNIVLYYGALRYKLAGRSKFQQLTQNMQDHCTSARIDKRDFMACDGAAKTSADDLERKWRVLSEILKPLYRYRQAEVLSTLNRLWHSLMTKFNRIGKAGRKHDYVYAMLGLVPADARIVPDYSKPFEEVYADSTFAVMRATKDMACLLGASMGLPNMPTWAVDYSEGSATGNFDVFSGQHCAGKHVEFNLQKGPRGAIIVNGVLFDTVVSNISSFDHWQETRYSSGAAFREGVRNQVQKAVAFYAAESKALSQSEDVTQELIRILACGASGNLVPALSSEVRPGRLTPEILLECHRRVNLEMRDTSVEREMLPRLYGFMGGKKLFVTANGKFGLAEKELQIGDLTCVLGGCSMPLCVRSDILDSSKVYKLISPCYLDGVMDGEALRIRQAQLIRDGVDVNKAVEQITLI